MNGMVDPTLTKADAHRVFGDLYRKPRSPELQAEVDKIVASTSDVFVRIERIEQLDAKQKPSGFSDEDLAGDQRRQQQRRRSGATGKSAGKPNRTASAGKKKNSGSGDDSVGWFERLFGSAISRWGKKTATLESGLFSKPRLSDQVYGLFRGLREDQLTASVKALRALAGGAWEVLEPARYNTMIAAYQFLTEFARAESTLRKSERPEDWITGTIKMQKFYALLEQYPDWQKIITGDIIELTRKTENIAPLADTLAATMKYIATLNSRKPSFKNAIIAMYTLARDRVCDWDDVLKELKIRKPALDTYRAPDQVTTRIHQRITDLRNKYNNVKAQLDDINRIKEKYYQLDSDGRLKTDFLNPIVREAIRRTFGDGSVSDSSVAAYKREAHRLLYAV
ncbi:MAG: hypothetical protein KDK34_08765, partial [Leptospiraceae bacterium]|nr:hypothetical protein [Leptospiraceae bacterium]